MVPMYRVSIPGHGHRYVIDSHVAKVSMPCLSRVHVNFPVRKLLPQNNLRKVASLVQTLAKLALAMTSKGFAVFAGGGELRYYLIFDQISDPFVTTHHEHCCHTSGKLIGKIPGYRFNSKVLLLIIDLLSICISWHHGRDCLMKKHASHGGTLCRSLTADVTHAVSRHCQIF